MNEQNPRENTDRKIADLQLRNRLLEQRLQQAERIRQEWSNAVKMLREAKHRERAHLQKLRDMHADLEHNRRFIKGITDCMGEGIYTVDHDGHVTFMNPEAECILGWSLEQVMGRNMHQLIHSHHRNGSVFPPEECPVLQAITSAKTYRSEEDWFEHRDGHLIPVAYVAAPLIEDDQVVGSVAVFQDTSLRREMEEQLMRSEKMAALGGMVAGVAHEINTPLGVAVTAVSYLESRTDETNNLLAEGKLKKSALIRFLGDMGESLSLTSANLDRAARLVRSFKMVSAEQTSDARGRFGLKQFLDSVVLTVQPRFKKTPHTVTVDCPDGLEMDSYPGALAQVITNLIDNSLVHGLDTGRPGNIRIEARANGADIELLYSDDGKGIPAQDVEKVFEPFFTTRRNRGSTGLGMHIIYNQVSHTLKGDLELDRAEGGGMRMRMRLPRVPD